MKTDRRSRRSQKLLFEALTDLIRQKDYEQITVSEIAERADVARVTFYAHFDSKEALLLSSLDTLFAQAADRMGQFSRQDLLSGSADPSMAIFELVQRDPALFQVILNGQGGALILRRFRNYAATGTHRLLENLGEDVSIPRTVIANFIAGALLAVVSGWLEEGMKQTPDEMAAAFYQLLRPSIVVVLGLE